MLATTKGVTRSTMSSPRQPARSVRQTCPAIPEAVISHSFDIKKEQSISIFAAKQYSTYMSKGVLIESQKKNIATMLTSAPAVSVTVLVLLGKCLENDRDDVGCAGVAEAMVGLRRVLGKVELRLGKGAPKFNCLNSDSSNH